jgi:hypothetical protein
VSCALAGLGTPMLTAAAARAIVPKASLRDSSLFIDGRFTVVGDSGLP